MKIPLPRFANKTRISEGPFNTTKRLTKNKNNNISSFHIIKPIQSKRQSPNLKKLLTKAEFPEVLSSTFNCSDKKM